MRWRLAERIPKGTVLVYGRFACQHILRTGKCGHGAFDDWMGTTVISEVNNGVAWSEMYATTIKPVYWAFLPRPPGRYVLAYLRLMAGLKRLLA